MTKLIYAATGILPKFKKWVYPDLILSDFREASKASTSNVFFKCLTASLINLEPKPVDIQF